MTKEIPSVPHPSAPAPQAQAASNDNTLGIISIVLGLSSLTGPLLFFGIPAIICGAIALKKKKGESWLSIVGIVSGALSIVISILVAILIIVAIGYAASHPDSFNDDPYPQSPTIQEDRFNSSSL